MHRLVLLGDDIVTIDTESERSEAARLMRDAGVLSLPIYRGGPETDLEAEGRDFCATETGWRYSGAGE